MLSDGELMKNVRALWNTDMISFGKRLYDTPIFEDIVQ